MTASGGTPEREHKLLVPDDWTVPDLTDCCTLGPETVVEQTATYHDAPDLRLARAGASLRFRDDDGWTVKLPDAAGDGGALVRTEHHVAGDDGDPPEAALDLVAALVRTARVGPVARLRTTRRRRDLVLDGRTVAILTDDRVELLDRPGAVGFREVEVELAPDAPGDAVAVIVDRLRDAGGRDADARPKVVRALGPAAAAPPDIEPYPVGRPATVPAVIRHALADAVARLVAADPVVRLGTDPEGVHQARVATRRLRSHLRTFRPVLDRAWSEPLRAELRALGQALGAVRDADVLLERLRDRSESLDERDQKAASVLLERLVEERAVARETLLETLRSPRYLDLLDALVAAARRPRLSLPVTADHRETLRALARTPWRRLRREVAHLPDDPPDARLHQVRIRAKRARYAAEAVEPAFGRRARRTAKALTRVQDVLGEHQDAVVAGEWLRAAVTACDDPATTFAAGLLAGTERRAAAASRDDWPDAWAATDRKKVRGWL